MDKKIIAVDFDGTLVFNDYPFLHNPNMRLINFIKQHKDDFVWILWTCRHGVELNRAILYLEDKFDLKFDYVNENPPWLINKYGDCRKLGADYFIDDKFITFEDLWRLL